LNFADFGPQVDHVGGHFRQTIVVVADAGGFHAIDAADEGDFAAFGEHRWVIETRAAGDEAAIGGIGRAAERPAGRAKRARDQLEAGAVLARAGFHDTPAPTHRSAGLATGRRIAWSDRSEGAL
jgi:hypothetical protein